MAPLVFFGAIYYYFLFLLEFRHRTRLGRTALAMAEMYKYWSIGYGAFGKQAYAISGGLTMMNQPVLWGQSKRK